MNMVEGDYMLGDINNYKNKLNRLFIFGFLLKISGLYEKFSFINSNKREKFSYLYLTTYKKRIAVKQSFKFYSLPLKTFTNKIVTAAMIATTIKIPNIPNPKYFRPSKNISGWNVNPASDNNLNILNYPHHCCNC